MKYAKVKSKLLYVFAFVSGVAVYAVLSTVLQAVLELNHPIMFIIRAP